MDMDHFINTGLLSGKALADFLNCCECEAEKAGFTSWHDLNIPHSLKGTIVQRCLAACAIPPGKSTE